MHLTPAQVVARLGGRATTAQILGSCSRHHLEASLRAGLLLRARRGIYVLPALLDPLQVAARLGGVVSHQSAARQHGYGLVEQPDRVHVTVPHNATPPAIVGVQLHWSRRLTKAELSDGCTGPLRTVLDCATTLPFAAGLAVADSALSLNDLGEYELRVAAARSPARGRRRRQRVADSADGRAANPFESTLRTLVIESGFDSFEPQLRIRLERRVVYVDLADRRRRLVIEGDSYTHHGPRGAFSRDCDRYDDLVAAGWIVLRFTWEQVMLRPDTVRQVIMETIARLDAEASA